MNSGEKKRLPAYSCSSKNLELLNILPRPEESENKRERETEGIPAWNEYDGRCRCSSGMQEQTAAAAFLFQEYPGREARLVYGVRRIFTVVRDKSQQSKTAESIRCCGFEILLFSSSKESIMYFVFVFVFVVPLVPSSFLIVLIRPAIVDFRGKRLVGKQPPTKIGVRVVSLWL